MRASEFIREFKDWTDITKPKKPESLLPPNKSPIKTPKKSGGFAAPRVGRTERPG